jgi:hypothetical protein
VVEICRAMRSGEGLEELFVKWLGRIRIDPDAERPTPAELVYRASDANDGVVFATPERARYVDGLFGARWKAIRSSRTPRAGTTGGSGSTSGRRDTRPPTTRTAAPARATSAGTAPRRASARRSGMRAFPGAAKGAREGRVVY